MSLDRRSGAFNAQVRRSRLPTPIADGWPRAGADTFESLFRPADINLAGRGRGTAGTSAIFLDAVLDLKDLSPNRTTASVVPPPAMEDTPTSWRGPLLLNYSPRLAR